MKREIVLDGQRILYTLRYSRRARNLRITVRVSRGLEVVLPSRWHERFVESFLREKSSWVIRHLAKMKKLEGKTVLKHSREEYHSNKHAVLTMITKRVEFFNSLYKFSYRKISIRNQTSLWGSCTREGNLQFNYKLVYLPRQAVDYIVVHELCHLKEHNHGKEFWDLVAKVIPHYKAIRQSLHQYVMQEG